MELSNIAQERELDVIGIRGLCYQRTDLVYSQLDRANAIDGSELVADFHATCFCCISVWKDLGNPTAAVIFVKQNCKDGQ